jgi:hypothetical protein
MAKIILFEKDNFSGKSLTLLADEPNFESRKFNDKVSSLIVRGGVWTLYEHINYGGRQWEVRYNGSVDNDGAYANHSQWSGENDMISSVKFKSQT